ncbi:MAG TPA: double zinc ribbon domain-containing protein [Gemmatimonadaceae bacterium]|nr:double zinc ribbon domain-containing protein [Gemmatimonadaceae bacterium]
MEGHLRPALNRGSLLRRAATVALDFLLPATCAACERVMDQGEDGLVCGRCWARLAPLGAPQCERCGHPRLRPSCAWCALLPPYVRAVRSVCWMHRGTGSSIVHALKYGGWHGVADGMARRLARLAWPLDVDEERTAVIPVPLARSRLRERGYNQSECLGAGLAPRWHVPLRCDVLERARATQTQTRLTPEERLANVSGAFRVGASARRAVRNAHLILVDDVVTTAATLNACAAALIAGGARIVSYVTFGRAPSAGDR